MTKDNISHFTMVLSDTANLPLLADIQYREVMATPALNRKGRGVLEPGVYNGFEASAGGGMKLNIKSVGESGALVNTDGGYQIKVTQQHDSVLTLVPGNHQILLEAFYDGQTITKQVDPNAKQEATKIVVAPIAQAKKPNQIRICDVKIPGNATAIKAEHIITTRRDQVYFGGVVRPVKGKAGYSEVIDTWLQSAPGKGFLPSTNNGGVLGTDKQRFMEVYANTYRGGVLNLTGTGESKFGSNLILEKPTDENSSIELRDKARKNGASLFYEIRGNGAAFFNILGRRNGKNNLAISFDVSNPVVNFIRTPVANVAAEAGVDPKIKAEIGAGAKPNKLWHKGNADVYATLNKLYLRYDHDIDMGEITL